jgi:hypothetical protein
MRRSPANRHSVSSAVSMITDGRPDPISTTIRFPTSVEEPSLAAEQVAAFTPKARAPRVRRRDWTVPEREALQLAPIQLAASP